jgi:hypothetical protein
MTKRTKHQPQSAKNGFLSTLSPLKKDLLCVGLLYLIVLLLFRGIVFDRMAFSSEGDTAAASSYAHAGETIMANEGVDAIWMPYFFSGMPTFGNVAFTPHNISYIQLIGLKILNLLFLNGPWTWAVVFYFLNGVFMFLLMRFWNFSHPAALIAAITVMLSPYTIGLAGEGHGSKLMALSYLPLAFLLTHLLFERRDVLSFGLLSAAIGTLLLTNHMQIAYYVFIVMGLYLVYHVVTDLKGRTLQALSKVALFVGALVIGMLISSYVYLSVYEYTQFSMRGGGTAGSTGGLTYDYATNWSWHPFELITLLIPSFFGLQPPYYWGPIQPWTNSTVYFGIIPLILSAVALVYNRNKFNIWLGLLAILVILISFGRNFPLVYSLMFEILPFFNKFRAPVMILHLLPFIFGFLAAYGFTAIADILLQRKDFDAAKLVRFLMYVAAGLLAAFFLVLLLKSSVYDSFAGFMFEREDQAEQFRQQYGRQAQQALAQFKQLRFELLWKDFVKFAIITVASLGIVILYLRKRIGAALLGVGLTAVLILDLVIVDVKFINPKPTDALVQSFRADATIAFLKQQPGTFRVFPLGQLFMDNTFAYHGVQSIGGYSPAKLKIYQTMLDSCLYHGSDPSFPLNMSIVNMLNVRYLVAQGRLPEDRFTLVNADQAKRTLTYSNPGGLPRVFFVHNSIVAQNDHEVFDALNAKDFDPSRTAILYKQLPQTISQIDTPRAEITDYKSRHITVKTTSTAVGLMVLSEVYYPAGWKAFIDGNETEIFRTNYVLRSILVPAGTHEVVFSFEPTTYSLGWTLTNTAWAVTGLCIVIGLWKVPAVRRRFRKNETAETPHTG